jgi:hypothetical protein
MTQIYLHIGYNKTGSSSIQSFLQERYKQLLEYSCLYPKSCIFDSAHYPVSATLIGHPAIKSLGSANNSLDELKAEIISSGCKKAIISTEYLVLANPTQISRVKDFMFDELHADSVKIIVYVRRHDEWIGSLFNQAVKTVDNPEWELNIRDYIVNIIGGKNPAIRYLPTIDRWAKVFGVDNIILRPFETAQFRNKSFISDFLGVLEIPYELSPEELSFRKNESLNPNVLYTIGLLRKLPKSQERDALISKTLQTAHALPQKFVTPDFSKLTASERQSIVSFFSEDYVALARRFLRRSDGKLFLTQVS